MLTDKKWYAIYTRTRWEKKVAGLLDKKHITTYCPLNRVLRTWSDRKKIVYEPLFRSYVFVHVAQKEMITVKETGGVLNFVQWLNKPAEIKASEIEMIKDFLSEHTNVQLEKIEVNVNDAVRIVKGPLMEYEGNVLATNKNKVKVYLHSLGYAMVVEVDRSNLEVVKKMAM
jgi:transcription antitermination factor NusG